jgi:hypothetical protein
MEPTFMSDGYLDDDLCGEKAMGLEKPAGDGKMDSEESG